MRFTWHQLFHSTTKIISMGVKRFFCNEYVLPTVNELLITATHCMQIHFVNFMGCRTTNMHQSHFGSRTFTRYWYTSIPVNHDFSLVEDRSCCTHLDVANILTFYMDTDDWQCEIAGGVTWVMFLKHMTWTLIDQSKDISLWRIGKQSFIETKNNVNRSFGFNIHAYKIIEINRNLLHTIKINISFLNL